MAAKELNNTILKNYANLKAYYRFESGALTTDSSGNGNTLTNNNSVAESTGVFGGAASQGATNASNKSLTSTANLGLGTGSYSISFWVKINAFSGDQYLCNFGDTDTDVFSRIAWLTTNTVVFYRVKSGVVQQGPTYSATPVLGTWYHLVQTYDGTNVRGYLNGQCVATAAASGNGTANQASGIFIGADAQGGGASTSTSDYDDVAFFNTALSADQIKELYEGRYVGEGWPQAGLVAGYHLNGNSTDFSGNNNHGTDTAMTYVAGKFNNCGNGNGTTGFILLPSITLGTGYTFSCWAYFTDNTAARIADCLWDSIVQRYVDNGAQDEKISFWTGAANLATVSTPALNTWHYIVAVRDGSTAYIYLNGKLENSGSTTFDASGAKRLFGRADVSDNTTYRHKGKMDEVQIYNVAKSADWVRKQYALGVGKYL